MNRKIKNFRNKYLPWWSILPLLSILLLNSIVYWGSNVLTQNRLHYDFTTDLDRMVPLIPEFVWIYILAYIFWMCGYILMAQRGKDVFYRFVATDLAVHTLCFLIFLILPTTNIRPHLTGNTISEQMLQIVYQLDGGAKPSNLFPSIHCYVSWLCYRGIKGAREIPVWYQYFSLAAAILIIISTQVLKQHYFVDAISGVALVEIFWYIFKKGRRHRKVMCFYETINQKVWKKK